MAGRGRPRRKRSSLLPDDNGPPLDDTYAWELIHFNEFCPEDVETCNHEKMAEGLEEALKVLYEMCTPNNKWRDHELYSEDAGQYKCIVCFEPSDSTAPSCGLYKRTHSTRQKLRAFVIHDHCLALIAMDKPKAIVQLKSLLHGSLKKEIEKYCIFEANMCVDCSTSGSNNSLVTKIDLKLVRCSDPFCDYGLHWGCARKSTSCLMVYDDRNLYCKARHFHVYTPPNDITLRDLKMSHSPADHVRCRVEGCEERVTRWPIRGNTFFVHCCEQYVHWDCTIARLKQAKWRCIYCGSLEQHLRSIQYQGHCLLEYKDVMKAGGIDLRDLGAAEGDREMYVDSDADEQWMTPASSPSKRNSADDEGTAGTSGEGIQGRGRDDSRDEAATGDEEDDGGQARAKKMKKSRAKRSVEVITIRDDDDDEMEEEAGENGETAAADDGNNRRVVKEEVGDAEGDGRMRGSAQARKRRGPLRSASGPRTNN